MLTIWSKPSYEAFFKRTLPYIYSIGTVVLATGILLLFRDGLNTSMVALLFLLPILVSTTLWGLGPGILTSLLTFLAYNFYFLLPYYTLRVHQSQDIIALIIFFIVAFVVSQLVGRAKTNLEAALAREQESTHLYELSLRLTGVNQIDKIASIIVEKTRETFEARAVRICVEKIYGEESCSVTGGDREVVEQTKPQAKVRLETERGPIGQIELWREPSTFSASEERLLYTFAAQSALALERAALTDSQNRAHVLEESDRMKSALLSSVSHEFRTPLVIIKAATTSLMNDQVDWDVAARQELLSAVDEQADHLNYLVGNLLNMSRIEAGALKPNRQWNGLAEILAGLVRRMHRTLVNHRLRIEIPDDFPAIPVDYMQIEQVFTNLLSNSAKYAPPGSEILIRAQVMDAESVLIQLTNQGPFVGPEHLDRIFEKFHRVTDADKITGTGLGLSISKGIVEAHGGQMWAENRPEGFTFHFTLPRTLDGQKPPLVESENE